MTDEPYQVTERGDPRDRIHNQRPLFDVDRTVATRCEDCGAARAPWQDKTPHCEYERVSLVEREGSRPKGCLNAHDPAHAPFPEGY